MINQFFDKVCKDGFMKTQKSFLIIFSFFIALFFNVAQAQFFGNFNDLKDKIKDSIKTARDSSANNKEIVTNSLLNLNGKISQEINWVLLDIRKDNFKEQIIIPVNNGLYDTRISLQDGAGVYKIELYSSIEKQSSNYKIFKKISVENTDTRDMSFLLPTLKVQMDDERVKNLVLNLTKKSLNDEQAFRAIYKHVITKIKYDHTAANNGTYIYKDYNAVNTLLSSIAVCEGYANLIAAMSRAYGIRTKVIFGQGVLNSRYISHAWNEVYIHGKWKVVDATWDSVYKTQSYLFMSPERFAQDHIKEIETKY